MSSPRTGSLDRPITCSKCGAKFTRQVRQQRRCERCMPLRLKIARQQRQAERPPESEIPLDHFHPDARIAARYLDALSLAEFLACPCPHGVPIASCTDAWCAGRINDLGVQQVVRTQTIGGPILDDLGRPALDDTGRPQIVKRQMAQTYYRSRWYIARPVPHSWTRERPSVTLAGCQCASCASPQPV